MQITSEEIAGRLQVLSRRKSFSFTYQDRGYRTVCRVRKEMIGAVRKAPSFIDAVRLIRQATDCRLAIAAGVAWFFRMTNPCIVNGACYNARNS